VKVRILRPRFDEEETFTGKTLSLRFSPTAWAKLLFFRDAGETEIGGFGITPPDDLLYIHDFQTVKQQVTCVSVSFDDNAVADFFETRVDQGRKPEQFARIWVHTHPGNCPNPSGTDEETFRRVFGKCQWSIMFIVAQEGKTYARISFNVGPGGQVLIPVEVDYDKPFLAADQPAWIEEYKANIHPEEWRGIQEQSMTPEERAELATGWPEEEIEEFDERAWGFEDPDNPWWWNY